jgi:hypothetical protein
MGSLEEIPHLLVKPPRKRMWWPAHKLKLWLPANGFFYDWLPRTLSDLVVGLVVQNCFALVDEILGGYIVQPYGVGIDMADEVGVRVEIGI